MRQITSCRIKAKENTSTLVSYSSFLKTSGAIYLPASDNKYIPFRNYKLVTYYVDLNKRNLRKNMKQGMKMIQIHFHFR